MPSRRVWSVPSALPSPQRSLSKGAAALAGFLALSAWETRCEAKRQRPLGIGTLRFNFGEYFRLGELKESQFAFDLATGAMLGTPCNVPIGRENEFGPYRAGCLWMLPEIGYSYRKSELGNTVHLGSVGLGVGGGTTFHGIVSYTPRFVGGRLDQQRVLGFRHSLAGHFLLSLLSLEISHQILSTNGLLIHEVALTVGLNLGASTFILNM